MFLGYMYSMQYSGGSSSGYASHIPDSCQPRAVCTSLIGSHCSAGSLGQSEGKEEGVVLEIRCQVSSSVQHGLFELMMPVKVEA